MEEVGILLIRQYDAKDKDSVKALYYTGLDQFDADAQSEGYLSLCEDLDNIENIYLKNNGEFLVGTHEGKLVAMGGLKKLSTTRAEIKRMGVHPDYQRQGFGQLILQKLLEVAAQLGYTELCLDTTAQNIPAQRLYERFGFVQARRKKIGSLDVIFYEKQLAKT
jgi:ribosomal protein S18 acetylase RimI-like enzyme